MTKITQSMFLVKVQQKSCHGFSKSLLIGIYGRAWCFNESSINHSIGILGQAWCLHGSNNSLLISMLFCMFGKSFFSFAAADNEAGGTEQR